MEGVRSMLSVLKLLMLITELIMLEYVLFRGKVLRQKEMKGVSAFILNGFRKKAPYAHVHTHAYTHTHRHTLVCTHKQKYIKNW